MAYSSQLSMRGWILAISLAGVLTGVFWFMHSHSLVRGLESYHARRTTNIVEPASKAPLNIAIEDLRQEILEPSFPNEVSKWSDYRSRPATSAYAIVEPSAGVRLIAPSANKVDQILSNAFLASQSNPLNSNPLNGVASSSIQSISRAKPSSNTPHEQHLLPRSKAFTSYHSNSGTWPYPTQLVEELTKLKSLAEITKNESMLFWVDDVQKSIEPMTTLGNHYAAASQEMDSLQRLATEVVLKPATDYHQDHASILQIRIAHSIIRRLAVWKAVWICISDPENTSDFPTRSSFKIDLLRENIDQVQSATQATGDVAGWEEYLLMDDLRRLAAGSDLDVQLATHTAQVLLSRITSINVSKTQRLFLDSASVRSLAESVQPLAIAPVDYGALLADIERLEEDAEHRSRLSLITAMQSLRFADNAKQVAISQAIDTYYRNANVRMAISEEFINRLLPVNKTLERPVRQNVLGAETQGNSNANTSLHVKLIPDSAAWNLNLELDGKIQSQTRSSRGPATFFNSSTASVTSSRSIRITAQGLQIQGTKAQVESNDALRSLETSFDGLPFVGDMVRYFAQQQFKEKRGLARRIMQRTIATQTDAEFDTQLERQLQQAENSFEQKLIGPLRNLNLNPMVTDLQTTNNRLIARYRIASDNALAANTPRPQAPADSLMSVQMHQSAMNNSLSQLGLSNRDWTLLELAQNLAKQFGQEAITKLPDEIPSDVLIRFDGVRPILIEFIDGRLWLTLRISSLSQPGRIELNDFVIRASYLPAVTGLAAELVLDGPISVGGDHLTIRERLPLRAIFAKVFSARSTIPLINQELTLDQRLHGLAISQLIVDENWLAIAIGETTSPHVALLRDLQIQR